jgi:hypothetical protein
MRQFSLFWKPIFIYLHFIFSSIQMPLPHIHVTQALSLPHYLSLPPSSFPARSFQNVLYSVVLFTLKLPAKLHHLPFAIVFHFSDAQLSVRSSPARFQIYLLSNSLPFFFLLHFSYFFFPYFFLSLISFAFRLNLFSLLFSLPFTFRFFLSVAFSY